MRSNEADIQLAILSITAKQIYSSQATTAVYNIAEITLRRRRVGIPP
jgi:hypothetical protein